MRQVACVVIFVAALLWPTDASAQGSTGRPCATATDAAELVLSAEQVGVGFSEEFVPSPGHMDEAAPGRLGWMIRGFQNWPVRVVQVVNTFIGPSRAAAFATSEVQAQQAVVRCGAFVVGMSATFERVTAERPSEGIDVTPIAWAILGTVAGVPADCVVTDGLADGTLAATCDDGGNLIYDPYSGQWFAS